MYVHTYYPLLTNSIHYLKKKKILIFEGNSSFTGTCAHSTRRHVDHTLSLRYKIKRKYNAGK